METALLEDRISSLVERHREASRLVEELRGELEDREARLEQLTAEVGQHELQREDLRKRVAGMIRRLKRLESGDGSAGT